MWGRGQVRCGDPVFSSIFPGIKLSAQSISQSQFFCIFLGNTETSFSQFVYGDMYHKSVNKQPAFLNKDLSRTLSILPLSGCPRT